MVTFTVEIQEQKPGTLSLDFVPSDKAHGTELEVLAGEVIGRAINNAITEVMITSEKSQSFAGDFVTDEWKAKLFRSLKEGQ